MFDILQQRNQLLYFIHQLHLFQLPMEYEDRNKERFKTVSLDKMRDLQKPAQWHQMDVFQGNNLQEFGSDASKQSAEPKQKKTKVRRKDKKATQLQEYQQALVRLRVQSKNYCKPFQKQSLNIRKMPAIKMLKDAIQNDKQFVRTLRNMGCKRRMRVRNKTAAKQLFEIMLRYLQKSQLPNWMIQRHYELLQKQDSKFDSTLKMEERDI